MEGRTSVRCKDLGRVVNRGERLTKLRDSLFSTKAVEAVPVRNSAVVKLCTSEGMSKCTDPVQTVNKRRENQERSPTAVDKYCTLRGKQPRSTDKVSKFVLSAKGSECPKTTWRWAWKQPSVKKRVTTYKMRKFAPEIQETKKDTEAVIWINSERGRSKGSRTFCKAKERKSERLQACRGRVPTEIRDQK